MTLTFKKLNRTCFFACWQKLDLIAELFELMSTQFHSPLYLNYNVLGKRNVFLMLSGHLVLCVASEIWQFLASAGWPQEGRRVHRGHVPTTSKERVKGCRTVNIGRMRVISWGSSTPGSLHYVMLNRLVIFALAPLSMNVPGPLSPQGPLPPVPIVVAISYRNCRWKFAFHKELMWNRLTVNTSCLEGNHHH